MGRGPLGKLQAPMQAPRKGAAASAGEGDLTDDTSDSEVTACDDDEPRSSEQPRKNAKHLKRSRSSDGNLPYGMHWPLSLRRRPPHPPQAPSHGFREFPWMKLVADTAHSERLMTEREMAQFYYEKSERQRQEIKRLHAEIAKSEASCRVQSARAEAEAAKYAQEKGKLQELMVSHVRAVNSVSSGLEPVTNQSFAEKFETLHHEVGQWCRAGFVAGEYPVPPDTGIATYAQNLVRRRIYSFNLLRASEVIDCTAWAYLETVIFPRWMPGMSDHTVMFMDALQRCIRRGDATADGEKTSNWRSETVSLLFQDPEFRRAVTAVSSISSDLLDVLSSTSYRPHFQSEFLECVDDSLRSILMLAAEMRCQRGGFRLDESVVVGAAFDSETMLDVRSTDVQEGTQARVVAVLSKGWIRIPPKQAEGAERRICRTRVVVTAVPEK